MAKKNTEYIFTVFYTSVAFINKNLIIFVKSNAFGTNIASSNHTKRSVDMIEMSQFILNSVVSSDPVINATDEAQPELLLNTDEQQIDDSVLLDPGAFVLLMAQMLSTGTISPDKSEQSELIPDDQTESAVDGESKNQPGIVATDEINKEILTSAQPDLNLEKNIAMTWINSGTYTPPQAQIAVSSTDNELRAATDFETLLTKESVIPDVLIKAMSYFKGDKENNFVAPPADTDIDIENTNVAKQTTIKENPLNQLTELMEQVAPGAVLKAPVTMTVLNPAHYDNETKQNTEIGRAHV